MVTYNICCGAFSKQCWLPEEVLLPLLAGGKKKKNSSPGRRPLCHRAAARLDGSRAARTSSAVKLVDDFSHHLARRWRDPPSPLACKNGTTKYHTSPVGNVTHRMSDQKSINRKWGRGASLTRSWKTSLPHFSHIVWCYTKRLYFCSWHYKVGPTLHFSFSFLYSRPTALFRSIAHPFQRIDCNWQTALLLLLLLPPTLPCMVIIEKVKDTFHVHKMCDYN